MFRRKEVRIVEKTTGINVEAIVSSTRELLELLKNHDLWDEELEGAILAPGYETCTEFVIDADVVRQGIQERKQPVSTCLYLHCVSHTPSIESAEIGVLTDLEEVQKTLSLRKEWMTILNVHDIDELGAPNGLRHMLRFMLGHPSCTLELRDEYGKGLGDSWPNSGRFVENNQPVDQIEKPRGCITQTQIDPDGLVTKTIEVNFAGSQALNELPWITNRA